MQTVVRVMMIIVCFNYLLKQTWRKTYFVIFSAVVCALFVGLTWPWAIEQSKNQIANWLSDTELMLDLSVVLTLEVALQIAFCILAAHLHSTQKVHPRIVWAYRILRWFPGMLIFPVLFCILVVHIFALPGMSFPLVSWGLAGMVCLLIPTAAWGLKRLLPEKDIRLELLFLSNALLAILGVIATVNGRTAIAGHSEVDWGAMGGILLLTAAGLIGGSVAYRIKLKRIIK